MSHVTRTQSPVPLRDRPAIAAAARALGAEVLFDVEARGWDGSTHRGEIVLKHPESSFDVALNKNADGVYEFSADLYDGSVQRLYGTGEHVYGRLVALYGAEVARKVALLRGYRVTQTLDPQTGVVTQKVVIAGGR